MLIKWYKLYITFVPSACSNERMRVQPSKKVWPRYTLPLSTQTPIRSSGAYSMQGGVSAVLMACLDGHRRRRSTPHPRRPIWAPHSRRPECGTVWCPSQPTKQALKLARPFPGLIVHWSLENWSPESICWTPIWARGRSRPEAGRSAVRTVRACAEQIRVPSFVLRLLAKIVG
jgi:hypothetical protein